MTEENDVRTQLHGEAYKECVGSIRSSMEAYDRNLITISSAFVALPVTFLRQLIGNKKFTGPINFYSSLGCFVITILIVTASFLLSAHVLTCELKNINDYYLHNDEDALDRKSWKKNLLSMFNISSGIVFGVGVLLMAVFLYRNIRSF